MVSICVWWSRSTNGRRRIAIISCPVEYFQLSFLYGCIYKTNKQRTQRPRLRATRNTNDFLASACRLLVYNNSTAKNIFHYHWYHTNKDFVRQYACRQWNRPASVRPGIAFLIFGPVLKTTDWVSNVFTRILNWISYAFRRRLSNPALPLDTETIFRIDLKQKSPVYTGISPFVLGEIRIISPNHRSHRIQFRHIVSCSQAVPKYDTWRIFRIFVYITKRLSISVKKKELYIKRFRWMHSVLLFPTESKIEHGLLDIDTETRRNLFRLLFFFFFNKAECSGCSTGGACSNGHR